MSFANNLLFIIFFLFLHTFKKGGLSNWQISTKTRPIRQPRFQIHYTSVQIINLRLSRSKDSFIVSNDTKQIILLKIIKTRKFRKIQNCSLENFYILLFLHFAFFYILLFLHFYFLRFAFWPFSNFYILIFLHFAFSTFHQFVVDNYSKKQNVEFYILIFLHFACDPLIMAFRRIEKQSIFKKVLVFRNFYQTIAAGPICYLFQFDQREYQWYCTICKN